MNDKIRREQHDDRTHTHDGVGIHAALRLDLKPQRIGEAARFLGEVNKRLAVCKRLLRGIGYLAFRRLGVHILLCLGYGRGVAEVIEVFARNFGVAQEVYIRLGSSLVLAALGDAYGVNEEVEALLGEVEAEVGVFLLHEEIVAYPSQETLRRHNTALSTPPRAPSC